MDDLISRQAAIEIVDKYLGSDGCIGDDVAMDIISDLTALAPAQPEQKKGKWIDDGDYQICSICGEEHCWENYRACFCDCCGADMRGG